jgi:hypothetical protein
MPLLKAEQLAKALGLPDLDHLVSFSIDAQPRQQVEVVCRYLCQPISVIDGQVVIEDKHIRLYAEVIE